VFAALDAEIFRSIRAGRHPRHAANVGAVASRLAVDLKRDAMRIVERRLQALRKDGSISASRKAEAGWIVNLLPDYGQVLIHQGESVCVLGNSLNDAGLIWCANWRTGARVDALPGRLTRSDETDRIGTAQVVDRCVAWAKAGNAEAAWWLGWWYAGDQHVKSVWFNLTAVRCDPVKHGWALDRIICDAKFGCMREDRARPSIQALHVAVELHGSKISKDWQGALNQALQAKDSPLTGTQVQTLIDQLIVLETEHFASEPLGCAPRERWKREIAWDLGVPTCGLELHPAWSAYAAFCERQDHERSLLQEADRVRYCEVHTLGYESPDDAECPFPDGSRDALVWHDGRLYRHESFES